MRPKLSSDEITRVGALAQKLGIPVAGSADYMLLKHQITSVQLNFLEASADKITKELLLPVLSEMATYGDTVDPDGKKKDAIFEKFKTEIEKSTSASSAPGTEESSGKTPKAASPKNEKALLKAMRDKLASLFGVTSTNSLLSHIQEKISEHFTLQISVMLTVVLGHADLSQKKRLVDMTTRMILANYLGELPTGTNKDAKEMVYAAKLLTSLYVSGDKNTDFKMLVLKTFEETLSKIYEKEELAEKLTDFEKDYEPVLEVFKQELFPAS